MIQKAQKYFGMFLLNDKKKQKVMIYADCFIHDLGSLFKFQIAIFRTLLFYMLFKSTYFYKLLLFDLIKLD